MAKNKRDNKINKYFNTIIEELLILFSVLIVFYTLSEIFKPGFLLSFINFNIIVIIWLVLFFTFILYFKKENA